VKSGKVLYLGASSVPIIGASKPHHLDNAIGALSVSSPFTLAIMADK